MEFRLLLVDDERIVRNSLARSLGRPGWEIRAAGSVEEACRRLSEGDYDLLIVDYRLGDGTGLEVLNHAKEMAPDTEVIMLTAHGNVKLAVEAMQAGAFDFLEKGSDPELTRHVVERALEQVRLRREIAHQIAGRLSAGTAKRIVAESQPMQELLATAREYADSDATILLQGETGSGKSLLAEFLHENSPRHAGPFITLNCCAIPHDLVESELFGYEDGAFTGASRQGKAGLMEKANGGTFFLDEVGDLAPDLQSKLLLVLEKGEILRVGSVEPRKVDLRFIAATNADLEQELAAGRFRRDLYYRLDVAPLRLPSLRERQVDLIRLAEMFLLEFNQRFNRRVQSFTTEAREQLLAHDWPGNIRELRNVVERAVLVAREGAIDVEHLRIGRQTVGDSPEEVRIQLDTQSGDNLLQESVRRVVERAWELSGGNQSRAAEMLGVPRTTLQHHLRKFGLS